MKSVPNVISTKDLSYLEDMLNWNFILIKKINNYIDIIKDEDVRKIFVKAYKELLDNYKLLIDFLE